MTKKESLGALVIMLLAVVALSSFFFVKAFPQDPSYHHFSDTAIWLDIPNTLNVLSNVPFMVVGIWGLVALWQGRLNILPSNRLAYLSFFMGTALVAIGSGYYHWKPDNTTLVYDRLPMTIAFMSLCAIIISEFVSERWGKWLLLPLLFLGLASVVYWQITEERGAGDLRFYAVVQFFPMLAMPVILLCGRSAFNAVKGYWLLLVMYLLAKLCEHFDAPIHQFMIVVSGHSIKHVLSALGVFCLLLSYRQRTRVNI